MTRGGDKGSVPDEAQLVVPVRLNAALICLLTSPNSLLQD